MKQKREREEEEEGMAEVSGPPEVVTLAADGQPVVEVVKAFYAMAGPGFDAFCDTVRTVLEGQLEKA